MSDATDVGHADAGPPEAEDDHDLLTLGLASDRLSTAIAEERERLAEAEAAGDARALEASRARVEQLESAAVRHRRVPITAVNAAQFYGFEPDELRPNSG